MNSKNTTTPAPDAPLSDNGNDDERLAVSLSCEVELMRESVQGVRLLVDMYRRGEASDEDLARIPHSCSAFLSLMEMRLNIVYGVMTDPKMPPKLIAAQHNLTTMRPTTEEVSDVLLPLD